MVESNGLLNRRTLSKCTAGSNPALSAIFELMNKPEPNANMEPRYVDGFVLPLRKKHIAAYRELAAAAAEILISHGALEYCECVGDDFSAEQFIPFPRLINAAEDETVVFAYVVFPSREARDQISKTIMADPRMKELGKKVESILECSRMAYGGFSCLMHRRKEN